MTASSARGSGRVLLACGLGCLVLVGLAGLGAWATYRWFVSEPEHVTVSVTAPVEVTQGDRFTFVARIRNTAARRQRLVSLDVADEYLEGIAVESTTPPFSEAMHVPIDDTVSYTYELPIPPGGEVAVVFNAYAAHAGDWAGDVDFCVNSATDFVSYPVRTIVKPR
jgi:hypothetical protein